MTDTLNELLERRADRAPAPGDPTSLVTRVAARAHAEDRSRRNRLTVVSGAALTAVVVTVGVVIAGSGSASEHGVPAAAGGRPTGAHGTSSGAAVAHSTTLVQVDPAPSAAEISLGLAPAGYRYLGHDSANAFYGKAGTTPQQYFSDGVVVDVHAFSGDSADYTLMVDGKPATYAETGGVVSVRVRYSDTVDVGFQAPPAVGLTKAQALQMAATIDVRSTAQQTHG